jgi:hypothetical protein
VKVTLSRTAIDRAEVVYVAEAKRAYVAAWRKVRAALPKAQATGGEAGDLNDPLVRRAIADTLQEGLRSAARAAAASLTRGAYVSKAAGPQAGPWAGWAGTGVPPIEPDALYERYVASLENIGGVQGMSDTALADMQRGLADFYADPEMSMSDLEARLAPYFSDWKATQVGITETTRLATEDRRMVAEQLNVATGTFDTSEDDLTCEECEALDQTTVDLADDDVMPPIHVGCVIEGTLVAGPSVLAVSERMYEGEVIILTTARGDELTVTPNHPILTPKGWVAAGLLNEGDNVICRRFGDGMPVEGGDEYYVPARIEKVADVARDHCEPLPIHVAAGDFHGDGVGSDVGVVYPVGLLRDGIYATAAEHRIKRGFLRAFRKAVALARGGAFRPFREGALATASGNMGSGGHGVPLLDSAVSDADVHGGGKTARFDSSAEQSVADGASVNAVLFGEREFRHAGLVESSNLIRVERVAFTGHVYNLHTEEGWYFASSMVAHNCRCGVSLDVTTVDEEEQAVGGE